LAGTIDVRGVLLEGGAWLAVPAWLICSAAFAQGTLQDYRRAEQFLPWNSRTLVLNEKIEPHWLGETDRFWYRKESRQGEAFVLVDARTGEQSPAPGHMSAMGAAAPPSDRVRSPDGRWEVYARDHNLYLLDKGTGEEHSLTKDGQPGYGYGSASFEEATTRLGDRAQAPLVLFSPDSRKLVSYRLDRRRVGQFHVVQSVSGARSILHSYHMAIPGDQEIAQAELVLFDVQSGERRRLEAPHLPVQFRPPLDDGARYRKVWWNETGTRLYFVAEERGYKAVRLHVADVDTGQVRQLFEERADTYINLDLIVSVVGDGSEIIWSSERDGWNHLYLFDGDTGELKNRVTAGKWVVRTVTNVDCRGRWIYFIGSGREPGRDPYLRHLYRVRFDGSGLELLTPEDADHTVVFSPTGRYFTDTYSKANTAPVSVLRSAGGSLVRRLETTDVESILATGWRFPEPFHAKADDGVTDIYGLILRPSNFDPHRRYPVIDDVYPGPQHTKVFKSFSVTPLSALWAQSTAELGFIVVLIDGRGTPHRSRAFREASYGNMGDAGGLEDHIAVMRQLAARYPYMDLDRVGVYGHSGGGYATARALLKYPEFFKVGVAAAGNHDQRTYSAGWAERWQGYPPSMESYRLQANATLAENLKGKLLLVHGDMDDNVHVTNALQLADALIAANKDFDLLILPNRDHVFADVGRPQAARPREYAYADPYFLRRRWDYFVEHLLGVAPPAGFRIAD
jgi:dipeptidyl-peptidase-4